MRSALLSLLQSPVLVAVVLISGIGGTFQYGFHVSVLTSPSSYIKELVNSTCVQRYGYALEPWELSLVWSFIVSLLCFGGMLGSLCATHLASALGRKRCLLLNNVLAIAAALLMILSKSANSFELIMLGRFLSGINAGVSLTVHPMYLLECTPRRLRALIGTSISSFLSLGKFFGQLLGISELLGTETLWPFLLAFSGLTALLQLVCLPFLPESPRYLLLEREDASACEEALRKLRGPHGHRLSEVKEMQMEQEDVQDVKNHGMLELLLERSVRWQLLTIIVIFTTVQLCGINVVYLYSSDVFLAAGIPEYNLGYVTVGTGLCEFICSIFCGLLIESVGKKVVIVWGYFAMAATLLFLTITLYLQAYVWWMPYCSMMLVFFFIASFCSGPNGVLPPLPSEIFTQSFQSAAFTLSNTLNWVGLISIGMVFPFIVACLDYFCFLVFFPFCLGTALFVWFNVPEIKNRTVTEISAEFDRMHGKARDTTDTKLNAVHVAHVQTQIGLTTKF
ncbi:solute carrier family 2 member 11, like [Trichomycterus rosablanca]|uniref:solute carrier family 2 member 11, like n=1 Tax=Trichomycterus rosablanca TaxID=2290929 RepID=UPI002F356476